MPKLTRRQFLKIAGATSAVAAPTLLGVGLLKSVEGELPPRLSPYAETPEQWRPRTASARPILVVTNARAENSFGAYLPEILCAEGLNCFQVIALASMDQAALSGVALVLLAAGPVDTAQAERLREYVARGGRLIAMRPDETFAALFGVERLSGEMDEGYIQVSDHVVGQGIASATLQFHGAADHYRMAGADVIAWLTDKSGAQRQYPAVTLHRYEQGQAALWAFDLAHSLALMRQGNPAWANLERDGRDGLRAHDAFVGWIDLDRIALPQADEQMRLLTQLVSAMLSEVMPVPRLWYFPGAAETMLIATGDSHQNPASAIEEVLTRVEGRGGHFSIYYTPPSVNQLRRAVYRAQGWANALPVLRANALGSIPSPMLVADWQARGHEFALHPYVEEGLDAGWQRYWQVFTALGYGPVSPTVRTHRVLWSGWVETALAQSAYGLQLNLDYYHTGPAFQNVVGEWVYGHFTGSGLPMKFIDAQGRVLNLYQQLTHLVDEHLLTVPWGGNVKLSGESAVEVSQMLLDRSLAGGYSAITAQFHVDPFAVGGQYALDAGRWLEGTLDDAASRNVPIWSALEWLQFTEVRHDAALDEVRWDEAARRLTFTLNALAAPAVELAVMVPAQHNGAPLTRLEVDGQITKRQERNVGGARYAWASAPSGVHQCVAVY
jgi:hypothetical protein